MRNTLLCLVLLHGGPLIAATQVSSDVAADAIVVADYAWQFPLRLDASSDVHVLEITPDVYRSVADPQLLDLRLITKDGREVGFGPVPAAPVERWREMPWAMQRLGTTYEPMPNQAFAAAQTADGDRDDYGLRLRPGEYAARAAIKLKSNAQDTVPIRSIRIEWSASADLPEATRWWVSSDHGNTRVILPDRVVSRFDAGQSKGQTRMTFVAPNTLDLRDLLVRVQAIPSSLSVDAVFAEYEPDPAHYQYSVEPRAFNYHDQTKGTHGFMLEGPYPVHAAAIELASGDALATMTLLTRDTQSPWWQELGSTTAFAVKVERARIERDRILFQPTRHRQWLLRSTPALGAAPKLRMYYRPDRFLIAHTGPGDLILLAGHRSARRPSYPVDALMNDLRERFGENWSPAPAHVGARIEIKGAAALKAPPPPPPYRKWALWAALVLGAAVIAWMALSLLKETKDRPA
jgi:hypothetical protein